MGRVNTVYAYRRNMDTSDGIYNTLTDNGDGTFTLKQKDQTRYTFDNQGRLPALQTATTIPPA